MTLILARVTSDFVLQVVDQLVTLDGQPFDKVAIKSLLFIAYNGIVAISYTGTAYLNNLPTDHWIAEELAGMSIDRDAPPIFIANQNRLGGDIGQALGVIAHKLNSLTQSTQVTLDVVLNGWQWDTKRKSKPLRPLVGGIKKTLPGSRYRVYFEPRHWWLQRWPLQTSITISVPRNNFSDAEIRDLSRQLRDKPAAEAEEILVGKIREVSHSIPRKGTPRCSGEGNCASSFLGV